jgi:hypothetical protein
MVQHSTSKVSPPQRLSVWTVILAIIATTSAVRADNQPMSPDSAAAAVNDSQQQNTGRTIFDVAKAKGPDLRKLLRPAQSHMQEAAATLAREDVSGHASASQQQAITELDGLIASLQKQCEKCGGQCNKPGSKPAPPKPGAKSGPAPGQSAATVATQTAVPADRSAISGLVKNLWGQLPERQREELLQPLSEEFLPAYAADIEEYFRVLAESPQPNAAEKKP